MGLSGNIQLGILQKPWNSARGGGGSVALSLSTVMIIILDESSVLSFSLFISPTLLVGL